MIDSRSKLRGINPSFLCLIDLLLKNNDSSYFSYQLMNISPHLLIDAVILSAALTITLVLRAKGNASKKEEESKWLLKKKNKSF